MSSKLTFSIEESLWLNRGQEISEVLAMSLEPNISIQELGDHVVIKGGLLLHGEYRPLERENSDDTMDEDVKLSSHRLAKEVTVSEDGIGEVKHFIPIDVTIPTNRIQNLDDIYVHIESFDYDLPERSCIQLTADITISGMSEVETQSERNYEQANRYPSLDLEPFQFEARRPLMPEHDGGGFSLEEEEDNEEATLATEPFLTEEQEEQNEQLVGAEREGLMSTEQEIDAVEARQDQEHSLERELEEPVLEQSVEREVEEEPVQEQSAERELEEEELVLEQSAEREEEEVEPVQEQSEERELEEVEPVLEPFAERGLEEIEQVLEQSEERGLEEVAPVLEQSEERELEQEQLPEPEPIIECELEEEPIQEVLDENEVEVKQEENELTLLVNLANSEERMGDDEVEELSIEDEAELEMEEDSYSRKEENALYLTKMLQNGEEQFTRLKMCIIQENESLSTIAERYNLTTTQLIRANQLEEETVTEGQILYIPASASR